ncbi:MAG: 6-phosphofructokinase [Clostridiales bacterium]|nr:6-phosphofructokinase [Clostridiales bacterium]
MNVVVGQSGGPTVAINASLAGVFEEAVRLGAEKVYGMQNGIAGFLQEKLVELNDLLDDSEKIELLKRTPACFLGSCRHKLKGAEQNEEEYKKIFSVLEKYDIGYFFYIGGNDSMDTVAKLSAYANKIGSKVRFVGVPKTIDNDLTETDHTPGYGSAAKFVATTMKELVRDTSIYDLYSVTIVEVMGRNAGWLTAASALAKGEDCCGVDMIFLPETPFTMDGFFQKLSAKLKEKKSLVIAVSEGIKLPDGRYVCELASSAQGEDVFGHKQLTGTALFLAGECANRLKIKARAIELSTLQRCASHIASLTDIEEAYRVGAGAVQAAAEGKSGVASVFIRTANEPYSCAVEVREIDKIANQEKTVPLEWIDTEKDDLTEEYLAYARPLIQGELTPVFENGLPKHLCMK